MRSLLVGLLFRGWTTAPLCRPSQTRSLTLTIIGGGVDGGPSQLEERAASDNC